jgi:hypothetical protein
LLRVKFQDDSCNLDIAGYEDDNQIALSLTVVKGDGIKFKKLFLQ